MSNRKGTTREYFERKEHKKTLNSNQEGMKEAKKN